MVARVAQAVESLEAVLVGGQAVNFWAEVFSQTVPELEEYGPFTSKDVDFYGPRRAAIDLAQAIGGQAAFPSFDDQTPNTAIVSARIDEYLLRIDFLSHVLGVSQYGLTAVVIEVELESSGGIDRFNLKILHPFGCLVSRINTIMHPAISRSDDFAFRQIKAAYHVFKRYIHDCLDQATPGNLREACKCLSSLHDFLLNDTLGRSCHIDTPIDPFEILKSYAHDERLDARYREKVLANMITRIEAKRSSRARRGN